MGCRGPSSDRHDAKYLCVQIHSSSVVMFKKLSMLAHVAVFGDFPSVPVTLTLNEGLKNMYALNGRDKNCLSIEVVHTQGQKL